MSITSLPSRIICRIHAAFSSNDHCLPANQSSIVSAPILRAYAFTRSIFSPITTGFSSRLACRAPRVSAAPPPARSSAAFSIPTPSPPNARGSEAKPSISSAIWATPALASRALRKASSTALHQGIRAIQRATTCMPLEKASPNCSLTSLVPDCLHRMIVSPSIHLSAERF